MPVTTLFSSSDFHNGVAAILREHLLDYFPSADYVITFEPPSVEGMRKPIIWLEFQNSENLEVRTHRAGKTLQRKELMFAVSMFTNPTTGGAKGPSNKIREMAATFERNAILRDGYKLADASLKHATITPFIDIIEPSQQLYFRKMATLSLVVYVEAT